MSSIPPQHLEAEMTVIGAIVLENERAGDVGTLSPEDFYRPAHRRLYEACVSLIAKGEAVDLLTVPSELGTHDLDEDLRQCVGVVTMPRRIRWAAKEVVKAAETRALIHDAQDAIVRAYERDLDGAMGVVAKIGIGGRGESRLADAATVARSGLKALEAEQQAWREGGIAGIPSGLWALDHLIGGLMPQDYAILAARPSMGKTSLALSWTLAAAGMNYPCMISSLEMSTDKLFKRALGLLSQIPIEHLRRGMDSFGKPVDTTRVIDASTLYSNLPIWIDDTGAQKPSYIRSIARQVRRRTKAERGLVIVDHLNIAGKDGKGNNRNEDLTEVSAAMKALAKDIGWSVLALCQLSRKCEERANKRPLLSDLRESGALEQDADIVIGVYRDHYYTDMNPNDAELIVLKNRDGATKTVNAHWNPQLTQFSDVSGI